MIDNIEFIRHLKDDVAVGIKVTVAWALTGWGHVTTVSSAEIASWLAIIYTSVSLWVLVRDKIIRRRRSRKEAETASDYTTL